MRALILGAFLIAVSSGIAWAGDRDGLGRLSPPDVIGESERFELDSIGSAPGLRTGEGIGAERRLPDRRSPASALDCVPFHERVERNVRQKFSHRCDPAADIDTGLPAFTTR